MAVTGRAGGKGNPRRREDLLVRPHLGARLFFRFCRAVTRQLSVLLLDLRIFDGRRVPRQGPLLLAPNHQSYLDPILVGLSLPQAIYFLARDSLFRSLPSRWILGSLNTLPIPREGAASRRAIEAGRAVLEAGEATLIFPEGTRSRDGKMGPVKRGVELIARPSGAPVVPVYIDGTFAVMPRGGGITLRPVRIFFGRPRLPGIDRKDRPAGEASPEDRGRDDRDGVVADLVTRLVASYRSLEARARRVRWAGDVRSRGFHPGTGRLLRFSSL